MLTNPAPVLILSNYYTTWTPDDHAESQRLLQVMSDGLKAIGHRVEVVEFWKTTTHLLQPFSPEEWIVFNWCEGVEDEIGGDARICEELEQKGYTYTGNSPYTLRLSVQKGKVKKLLQRHGIPTPAGRQFNSPDEVNSESWDNNLFPAIVKPVSQHCSVAVTRSAVVQNIGELRDRVAYVVETLKEPVIAEQFILGREINVSIWGNGRPQLLPLREIDFSRIPDPLHHIVTWDCKWVPDSPDWNSMPVITQPQLSPHLRAGIEEVALKTYRALRCRDYARVDLRISRDQQIWVVDVNPNPDLTPEGGFAGSCYAAGFTYAEAISHIVRMAVARHNRRATLLRASRRSSRKTRTHSLITAQQH